MFDIGFLELIIVAVLALLILGPERLPKAAQTVGRWVGKARRMASTFSQEIDRQLEIETLREQLKEQGKSININDDANKIHETVSQALSEASLSAQSNSESDQNPKADAVTDTHSSSAPEEPQKAYSKATELNEQETASKQKQP